MHRIALLAGLLCWSTLANAWHFDVIGDTPYSDFERQHLPELLDDLRTDDPAFVVHVGDFKAGSARCDTSTYKDRRELFDALDRPLIYLPGDNDWTDCHRENNGGYDPVKRLKKLRSIFFDPDRPLGGIAIETTSQKGFPENRRWTRDGIVFVTVHLVGSHDNADKPREYRTRSRAGRRWLAQAADMATAMQARALVIFAHGDPHFQAYAAGKAPAAYGPFLNQLRAITARADHQVVFVHGDSHTQTIDQPLLNADGQAIANFTRVESFGYPFMGWIRFSVTNDSKHPLDIDAHVWAPHDEF